MGQVQSYKRKITYFYQFHNGNVGSTAGFLKLEIRGEKVKIIINIQEPPGLPYKSAMLYFYHEAGDHLAALKVDEIKSTGGILAYQTRTDWQQLFDTGRDLYTFDGVAVVYNDSHYYIGDFQDKNRKDYELVRKDNRKQKASLFEDSAKPVIEEPEDRIAAGKRNENMPASGREEGHAGKEQKETETAKERHPVMAEKEDNAVGQLQGEELEEKAESIPEVVERAGVIGGAQTDVFEKCEDCPYHRKRMEQKEETDAFDKMIAEYPKLPLYGATELFNCVRIHPKDIGKLDMRNWKLGVNSFLTHGFYTYQYLLLGKMRFDDGSEHAIIGVPGVFSNREKYLANMFGFEQFIPVKKTGVKTGEFGYWIVEISPGL